MASVRAEETRQRIKDVALELFNDRGYEATSLREIASRLGFTKAALYYHFRSKQDLLVSLIEPILTDLSELIEKAETVPPTPGLRRALVDEVLDLMSRHQGVLQVAHESEHCEAKDSLKRRITPTLERLQTLLAGANPSGATRVRAAAVVLALHLAGNPWFCDDVPPSVVRSTLRDLALDALDLDR